MMSVLDDLRIGVRLLWKDKLFAMTATFTLALCVGANTALFSIVHNVLLRPLPVPDSDRIMLMSNEYPKAGAEGGGYSGAPDYYDRLRGMNVFDEQAMFTSRSYSVDQGGVPIRLTGMVVTPSFFRLVETAPIIGRSFTNDEGEVGNDQKVILSYGLWQSNFGGARAVVGRTMRIDEKPYTIVGVMPAGFTFVDPKIEIWLPLAFTDKQKSDESRHSNNWRHIGRLKPGATRAQAQAQVDAINAANLGRFPQYRQLLINAGFRTDVTGLQDFLVRDIKPTLYLMWGGALFVLLIGCVNVANLVLVRSRARLKELATRLALGAGRLRVTRQLVTESVMLTLAAAVLGLGVGAAALRLLTAINIQDLPRGGEIQLDGVVVFCTLSVAVLIGVVLGLIPAATVAPANLTVVLREEGRSGTSGRGARTLRRALVVAQVAFAFILLIGAGLLFASFRRVLAIDPGFNADGVLTASVMLPPSRYANDQARVQFLNTALARLRALPGVSAAGATDAIPFGGNHSDNVILAEGYQMRPGESVLSPTQVDVSDGYFEAMRAHLVDGRFFNQHDTAESLKVIIVDEKLARRFWPNRSAIGRRMYLPTDINNLLAVSDKTKFFTVVGVIREIKLASLTEGDKSVGAYYFPMSQDTSSMITFAVRTPGDPIALASSVRGALSEIDRELPVFGSQTMNTRLDHALVERRSPMFLSLAFGGLALFLSAIGIYGVLAYLVTQRRKEIGIRIALGSSGGAVFQLVLREGLLLIGSGLAFGGTGAFVLRRSLQSQLFGVRASDPLVIGLVTLLLATVAILACTFPARRATRIDPMVVLAE
ncbi:MAG: ABC transporter permease [Vicinamibacterales bacterium]